MSEQTKRFWDESSRHYRFEQWERTNVAKSDYSITRKLLLRFLDLKKDDKALEIGCGPGKWSKIVSGDCANLTAVDISKKMINEAKKYCKDKNVRFLHGDIMKLRLNQKFDKIYAVRVLEYIKDKEGFVRKMSDLLNENGKFVVVTKSKPCLWDITKREEGFWQEKITYNEFRKLLKRNFFHKIKIKPVIIRLPIFANGNREFPIIGKTFERPVLSIFRKLTEMSHNVPELLEKLPMLLSESYITCAEKRQ